MKIGLAGDWHGQVTWTTTALSVFGSQGIHNVFQLGDFGLGWPGGWDNLFRHTADACTRFDVNLFIVPGNHENWDWIDELEFTNDVARIHPRISVLGRGFRGELPYNRTVAALGGAPSIDYHLRTAGMSWWPTEMIKLEEAEHQASLGHADIFLAHDAPDGTTDAVERIIHDPDASKFWSSGGLAYAREGRELMNIAFQGIKPKVFAHGHYHVADEKETDETKFLSLGPNGFTHNLLALDLKTLEHEWLNMPGFAKSKTGTRFP